MPRRKAASRRSIVAIFATAFAFGAFLQSALAVHFHTFNGVNHGVVHGSNLTDYSFFGRTQAAHLAWNYCAVGDTLRGWYGSPVTAQTWGTDTCQRWSARAGAPGTVNECISVAYSEVGFGILSGHVHYAHYYGGDCPYYLPGPI